MSFEKLGKEPSLAALTSVTDFGESQAGTDRVHEKRPDVKAKSGSPQPVGRRLPDQAHPNPGSLSGHSQLRLVSNRREAVSAISKLKVQVKHME